MRFFFGIFAGSSKQRQGSNLSTNQPQGLDLHKEFEKLFLVFFFNSSVTNKLLQTIKNNSRLFYLTNGNPNFSDEQKVADLEKIDLILSEINNWLFSREKESTRVELIENYRQKLIQYRTKILAIPTKKEEIKFDTWKSHSQPNGIDLYQLLIKCASCSIPEGLSSLLQAVPRLNFSRTTFNAEGNVKTLTSKQKADDLKVLEGVYKAINEVKLPLNKKVIELNKVIHQEIDKVFESIKHSLNQNTRVESEIVKVLRNNISDNGIMSKAELIKKITSVVKLTDIELKKLKQQLDRNKIDILLNNLKEKERFYETLRRMDLVIKPFKQELDSLNNTLVANQEPLAVSFTQQASLGVGFVFGIPFLSQLFDVLPDLLSFCNLCQ